VLVPRSAKVVGVFVGVSVLVAGYARASRPAAEEMAQRDCWVREHFPAQPSGAPSASAPAKLPDAGLMVWTNYGPVLCNIINGRPLQIADQKFEHGIYCHAPSRIQVSLPRPGKSFSAAVGILTNSSSQGGSVVFSVTVGEKQVYASAVLHRGELSVPVSVDINGAREFFLSVGCAGDGISSDQTVWAYAQVMLADGQTLRLGDLPLLDPLTQERSAATPPFSFFYDNRPSDELLPGWKFQEDSDASKPEKTTRCGPIQISGPG